MAQIFVITEYGSVDLGWVLLFEIKEYQSIYIDEVERNSMYPLKMVR